MVWTLHFIEHYYNVPSTELGTLTIMVFIPAPTHLLRLVLSQTMAGGRDTSSPKVTLLVNNKRGLQAPGLACRGTTPLTSNLSQFWAGGSLASRGQWTAVPWLGLCRSPITRHLQNPGKFKRRMVVANFSLSQLTAPLRVISKGVVSSFTNCPQTTT